MPYEQKIIKFWDDDSPIAYSGSTSMGYFDSDIELQQEAPKLAKYIAGQLGYPVQSIEITDKQIYDNIERAIVDYSSLMNEFNTTENYFDVLGSPSTVDFTEKYIVPNLNWAFKISNTYGIEAGAGGNQNWRSGFILVEENRQVYDLESEYFSLNYTGSYELILRKLYHYPLPPKRTFQQNPAMPISGIPYGVTSGYSANDSTGYGSQILYPMSWETSRIQANKMARQINASDFSFELIGSKLRLFPIPRTSYKLFFDYSLEKDRQTVSILDDVIGSPHQVKYDYLAWSQLNTQGRIWVLKYALALCKINLGINRRKFNSIPYPNGEVSLDGDSMVSDGTVEKEVLVQELREYLQLLSKERGIQIKRDMISARREMLNEIPLPIFRI
jgi:hypothetical protein